MTIFKWATKSAKKTLAEKGVDWRAARKESGSKTEEGLIADFVDRILSLGALSDVSAANLSNAGRWIYEYATELCADVKYSHIDPVAALAYALYDSQCTGRLGEDPDAQKNYIDQAEKLLNSIVELRPYNERQAIADALLKKNATENRGKMPV